MNKGTDKKQKEWRGIVMIQKSDRFIFILKCLLCAYILTGCSLLVLALLLYRFQLSETVVGAGITVIYVLSSFMSGWISGKKIGTRKFLWGLLMGMAYFFVLIVISLLINHTLKDVTMHFWTTLFLCGGSGMLGGMLS